jgi:hypothetical protein
MAVLTVVSAAFAMTAAVAVWVLDAEHVLARRPINRWFRTERGGDTTNQLEETMKRHRLIGPLGVVLAMLSPIFTITTAKADTTALTTAVNHVAYDNWTQADLDLIKRYPDVAATVPDPTRPIQVVIGNWNGLRVYHPNYTPFPPQVVYTTCGAWAWVDLIKKSLLGNVIYRWRHYVQYCRKIGNANGNIVSSWEVRKDYMVESQSGVYMRDEGSTAYQSGLGTFTAKSFRQRHIEYCVYKIGCYSNRYLYSTLYVTGNGGYAVGQTGGN